MYQQRSNGGFRARASFAITPLQIQGLNVICQKTGLSFGAICTKAVDKLLADYIRDGAFVYPDQTPVLESQNFEPKPVVDSATLDPGSGIDEKNLI